MSTSIRRLILVVLGALVAAMMSAQAAPPDQVCEKVLGKVLLIPEQPGTCTIDDGSGDYLGNPTPQAQPGCFTITLVWLPRVTSLSPPHPALPTRSGEQTTAGRGRPRRRSAVRLSVHQPARSS